MAIRVASATLAGMGRLNYQDPRDAGRELRTGWRRKLFGLSRADVWAALAQEINARHESGGWWKSDRVVASVDPWMLTLDTFTDSHQDNSTTYTRLRAPFVSLDGFRFRIYRKSIFSGLGKFLGMQDIEIGDSYFDEQFIIQSDRPQQVVRLLDSVRLINLLENQPRVMFQVKDDEGWFGVRFPPNVDELSFSAIGVIKDLDLLRGLFDLFAETLHQLVVIGSAADTPPEVKL